MSRDPGDGAAHPGRLALQAVRSLSPYQPGKPISELQRELAVSDIIKLASNENPYGPSAASLAAMRAALDEVWLYPDGGCFELKRALSRHLGVATEWLTIGNGSNDLLVLLAEAFLSVGLSAVYSQYGFAIYPLVIRATGAQAIEAAATPRSARMPLGHDLAAMLAAVRPDTRLLFIANPNNPTGTWVPSDEVERLLHAAPGGCLVVLDAAYFEYGRERGIEDALPWVAKFPNLVMLRTFSKAFGLAGARVAYAVSHPEVAEVLNRLRPAFNVNSLAQAGAIAALADQRHMRHAVQMTMQELQRVTLGLERLNLWVAPSAANFVVVQIGARAPQLFERLLERGIIVRPLAGYGLPDCLRISIGLPEHNDRLLAALAELLTADEPGSSTVAQAADVAGTRPTASAR